MKKKLVELNELINKMIKNHFLLPNSYSDKIQMLSHDFSYRTYVADNSRNVNNRYVNLEIYDISDCKIITIAFRQNNIVEICKDITLNFSLDKILEIVKAIYKEKHSFENHAEGIKPLKEKISLNIGRIRSLQKENEEIKLQIEGLQSLIQ